MNSDSHALRVLVTLVVAHFLVDAVASVVNPLWPTLQVQTGSSDYEFMWLILCWNVATSVSQIGFGLWGDRSRSRWLIWAGPAIAVGCFSLLGMTQSFVVLCVLVAAAGLGTAAFHPEGATLAGNCIPERRSRALSLFQVGGFLGQTAGPYYSGLVVSEWGTRGLLLGLIWMIALIAVAGIALHRKDPAEQHSVTEPVRVREIFRGQGRRLLILLLIGVLRIIPAAGVPMALAFLESARESTTTADIGLVQSAFTFGIGGGGLYCGFFVPRRHERLLLWLLPLLAAPIVWGIPGTTNIGLFAACIAAGVLLGTTIPILISLGQQLLPKSQRVGSSITMGLSWGIGGGLSGLIVMLLKPTGTIAQAFPIFALAAIFSGLACIWLPRSEMAAE